jgi:hypothetical protein
MKLYLDYRNASTNKHRVRKTVRLRSTKRTAICDELGLLLWLAGYVIAVTIINSEKWAWSRPMNGLI